MQLKFCMCRLVNTLINDRLSLTLNRCLLGYNKSEVCHASLVCLNMKIICYIRQIISFIFVVILLIEWTDADSEYNMDSDFSILLTSVMN